MPRLRGYHAQTETRGFTRHRIGTEKTHFRLPQKKERLWLSDH